MDRCKLNIHIKILFYLIVKRTISPEAEGKKHKAKSILLYARGGIIDCANETQEDTQYG